jgi:AcrR family transcriptional regulator
MATKEVAMEEDRSPLNPAEGMKGLGDVKGIVREVIEHYLSAQREKAEPAYKAELQEERRRREQLERRVNELAEENRKNLRLAEETDRSSQIRAELQRLGVNKIELAFKAVRDDICRLADGALGARTAAGEVGIREYLSHFVQENPELLPARIPGGSGSASSSRPNRAASVFDIDRIKPGMSPEELQQLREHISQIALQNLRGE